MDKPTKIPPPVGLEGAPVPPVTPERMALLQAAEWFDAYAESHEKQPGKEGHAIRNRQRAMFCRLVAVPGPHVNLKVDKATKSIVGVSKITGDVMWGPVE